MRIKRAIPLAAIAVSILFALPSHAQFGKFKLGGGSKKATASSHSGGGSKTSFSRQWESGNFKQAHDTAFGYLTKKGREKDKIEWGMEAALSLRAMGDYQASVDFFDRIDSLIEESDSAAVTSISKEAASLVTNLKALPYSGFHYERIMVSTYKALNYLSIGEREKARVEFRRAYERQRGALAQFEKRIQQEKDALDSTAKKSDKGKNAKMDKALENEKVQKALSEEYKRIDELAIYADYVNPFSVYLEGLYFMTNAASASDWERASVSLKRVSDMNGGNNEYLQADLDTVNKLLNKEISESEMPSAVYVIFETGRSAKRVQKDVKLPLGLFIKELKNVTYPLPNLQEQGGYDERLTVGYAGGKAETSLICNMDSVVAKEFKNNMPSIVNRTVRSVGAKAWVQGKVTKKMGGKFGIVANLGKKSFQKATNKADLRCWSALPKEFQSARIDLPEDSQLTLTTSGGNSKTVRLNPDARCQVVYVTTILAGDDLRTQTFDLL